MYKHVERIEEIINVEAEETTDFTTDDAPSSTAVPVTISITINDAPTPPASPATSTASTPAPSSLSLFRLRHFL